MPVPGVNDGRERTTNGRTLNVCTGSSSVNETLSAATSSNVRVPDLGGQVLGLLFLLETKRWLTETLSFRRLDIYDDIDWFCCGWRLGFIGTTEAEVGKLTPGSRSP